MAEKTDRMSMLREAYTEAAKDDEVETPVEEEVVETPAEVEAAPAEEVEAAPEETAEQKAERERDEKGRFAAGKERPAKEPVAAKPKPGTKTETAPPKPGETTATKPPEKGPETKTGPGADLKAPQSWTATAREAWKDVPPAARQEIHRLEGETRRVLQENASLRKTSGEATQFRQAVEANLVRPYESIFRAQGMDPYQGIASVVQTYAGLHVLPQPQKDAILANLVGQFGTLDGINAVLQGQGVQPGAAQPAPAPRAAQPAQDPREIVRQELQAARAQMEQEQADRDLDAFMHSGPDGGEPEFIRDVWVNMQAVLEAAHRNGINLPYREAYNRALMMSTEIQGILAQRKAAEAATGQQSAPAQRARVAAATVRSKPVTAPGGGPDLTDRRAMLQRALDRAR